MDRYRHFVRYCVGVYFSDCNIILNEFLFTLFSFQLHHEIMFNKL